MQIYLDYSATTPPRPEVMEAVQRVMEEHWGNPSSLHQWGNRSALVLEQSRLQVAELIKAPAEAIIFTAGGTEADNLAIQGVARHYHRPQHLIIPAPLASWRNPAGR
jgi:cysteine desulfurase